MSMDEDAWREGLRAKGRDWVLAELNMRPGLPQDPLLDVVYVSPYPTREFCQRWCVESDNQYLRLSGYTKFVLCGVAILGIFIAMAMYKWSSVAPARLPTAPTHGVQE
ncbi:MAG TPA: hypothetical protein VHX39_00680 [Acetobacteraceae bacterium]|jgi:hypothetical protein|nr:hypothetical protein [Acetobacteraceae bacterium]HEX4368599.1 hypothetical protein [Rhodopila sp.]